MIKSARQSEGLIESHTGVTALRGIVTFVPSLRIERRLFRDAKTQVQGQRGGLTPIQPSLRLAYSRNKTPQISRVTVDNQQKCGLGERASGSIARDPFYTSPLYAL